jgi:hypothetical protein
MNNIAYTKGIISNALVLVEKPHTNRGASTKHADNSKSEKKMNVNFEFLIGAYCFLPLNNLCRVEKGRLKFFGISEVFKVKSAPKICTLFQNACVSHPYL